MLPLVFVEDAALATLLRTQRILTSSLRHEPSEKFGADADDSDDGDSSDDFEERLFEQDDPLETYMMQKRKNPKRPLKKSPEQLAAERAVFEERLRRERAEYDVSKLLPLKLSPIEASLMLQLDLASLVEVRNRVVYRVVPFDPTLDRPNLRVDLNKFKVFENLHSKGFTMVDGMKFGVDFLAYSGDPLTTHAELMVLVCPQHESSLRGLDLTLTTTIANKTNKVLVLATAAVDGNVEYLLTRRKPVNLPRVYGRAKVRR